MQMIGKRIIVTGAAGGIGMAISSSLVEAGARVVLTDIDHDAVEAARKKIGGVLAVGGDITNEAMVEAIFARAADELGGIDGLVNSAGVIDAMGNTRRQELPAWRKVIDVNLQGAFLTARAAARLIQESGAIVNIASVAGLCAFPASNAYSVSKAGLVMMTKTLALDLARFGIRVNAVAPGIIDAPMAHAVVGENKENSRRMVRRIPMGRMGRSEEVATATRFLLSDDAAYITGAVLPVDGGWSAFGGPGDASFGNEVG